jgi:hypothetical protein
MYRSLRCTFFAAYVSGGFRGVGGGGGGGGAGQQGCMTFILILTNLCYGNSAVIVPEMRMC